MASISNPRIYAYYCDAVIAKGKCVKAGSADDKHVQVASAATDKIIGIIQNLPVAAEEICEVAQNGGGAKGLLGGTVVMGDKLTSDAMVRWLLHQLQTIE